MINLAVINLKELLKKLAKIIIVTIVVAMIFKFMQIVIKELTNGKIKKFVAQNYIYIMEDSLSIFCFGDENLRENKASSAKRIIASEIKLLSKEEAIMEQENQEEVLEFENALVANEEANNGSTEGAETEDTGTNKENSESVTTEKSTEAVGDQENASIDVSSIPKKLETKVNSDKNKKDSYNTTYGSVKIKNESKYTLTEDILKPDIEYSNKSDIVIFHTHTCESYTPTEANPYVASGNYRTTDLEHSVAKVGSVLTDYLTGFGYKVNHSTTYHDYPAYSGSYTRSMSTVKSILEQTPTVETVIDLHRDALGSDSSYGPTVQIGEERVAQLMFVIGTDGGGLEHSNWKQNLKLAVKIQEKANEMYPDLFKPMIVRNSRYNQHLAKGACIIEVGATGNTLEECTGSMKYLAAVISEVMK